MNEPASQEATRPRGLRVSDSEREHVVGVLEKAIGQGLLGLNEFTTRTDNALAASTRAELNIVLADLPGLAHPDAHPARWERTRTPHTDPGDHLELNAHGSTLKRSGEWIVPAELRVRNRYAETKLDFTEARVTSPVVHMELDSKWGSVGITIPHHAAVDVNSITEVKWGSLEDRTGTNGKRGNPRYVVTGRIHGGSLAIKHPRRDAVGSH